MSEPSEPQSGSRRTLGIKLEQPLAGSDGLELPSGVEKRQIDASLGERYIQHPRDRLTPDQRELLERAEGLARLMDDVVPIPGTQRRAGLDALLGIVPLAGDLVCLLVSLAILVMAWRLGARFKVLARMLGNLTLDLLIGIVPIVGDIFDVMFQANMRNVALLRDEVLGFAAAPPLEGAAPEALIEAPVVVEAPAEVEAR